MSKRPFVKMSIEDLLWLQDQSSPVRTLWVECAMTDPFGSKDGKELKTNMPRSTFFKAKKIIEEYGAFEFIHLPGRTDARQTRWFVKNLHGASQKAYWGSDSSNPEYQEFLQSDYWKQVREWIIERDNHTCQSCGAKGNLQVHHLTYEHHGREHEYPEDLVTVCRGCHEKIHNLH